MKISQKALSSSRGVAVGTLIALFGVSFAACSSSSSSTTPPSPASIDSACMAPLDAGRSDRTVLCSIPASVASADRADLYDALEALPDDERSDVTLFAPDRIIRNVPSNGDIAYFYQNTGTPGVFADPSGNEIMFPEEARRYTQGCGVGSCTGLLHKLQTAPGYSYFLAAVSIPCDSSQLSHDGKQSGFIYTGGTSNTGTQLDVGIQLNAPAGGSPGQPSSVQMFYTYGGKSGTDIPRDSHFLCGTYAVLKFHTAQARPTSKAFPTLTFTGTFTSGTAVTRTYVVKVQDKDGWSQVCTLCTVKRVTSLAVPPNQHPQTHLETWLGVTSPYSSSPQPTVRWMSATQGKYTTFGRRATPDTTLWTSTAYLDDPPDGQTTGFILAQPSDSANELVGINESGPRLQISSHGKR